MLLNFYLRKTVRRKFQLVIKHRAEPRQGVQTLEKLTRMFAFEITIFLIIPVFSYASGQIFIQPSAKDSTITTWAG